MSAPEMVECPKCGGDGYLEGSLPEDGSSRFGDCDECEGKGEIPEPVPCTEEQHAAMREDPSELAKCEFIGALGSLKHGATFVVRRCYRCKDAIARAIPIHASIDAYLLTADLGGGEVH